MGYAECGLKDCSTPLIAPAVVGFEIDGKTEEVVVCSYHAGLLMTSPPGTWQITANRELKAIPAKRIII